eukprot:SAG31_NODE_884_length_11256_cov_2.889666_8_plen_180_part_00
MYWRAPPRRSSLPLSAPTLSAPAGTTLGIHTVAMDVASTASPYPYDTMFVDPEPVLPPSQASGGAVLTDEQVERWRSEGYLFLTGVWGAELIARAAAEAHDVYPSPSGDVGLAAKLAQAVAAGRTKGPSPINFPSIECAATNEVALDPRCWKVGKDCYFLDFLGLFLLNLPCTHRETRD